MCLLLQRSVKWNREFDKTLQNFEYISWARCLLKTHTPALYDNEIEDNIPLRIRQLFAVGLTSGVSNFLATASAELQWGLILKLRSVVHL